jgi:hypothetical protein
MNNKFNYIIEKIQAADFIFKPFRHLYVENLLNQEHFDLFEKNPQINFAEFDITEELIQHLLENDYVIQKFPGCTESIDEYLKYLKSGDWPVDTQRLEAFGLAFRLKEIKNPVLQELVEFLNSPTFQSALMEKFSITRPNKIETAIQKYLTGYEISPHPDVRGKCLTYLVNTNTTELAEQDKTIHTHLLKFKTDKAFVADFWRDFPEYNTDWVPWDWCESKKIISTNNSLVMFAPSFDTLHAIKLKYDHCKFQRTQLYGNLWYTDTVKVKKLKWNEIEGKVRALNQFIS